VERLSRLSLGADFAAGSPDSIFDREERHVSLYRVAALTVAGRRELCVVRNVSSGGLILSSYSYIEPRARIAVEFKQGESVVGIVAWSNGNNVGMRFDDPIDVTTVLAASPDGLKPRMPRIGIQSTITIREGEIIHEALALDISQGGVCVECSSRLQFGSDVVVRIEGLSPELAVVRWRNLDCYGIGFNRLLSVTNLAAWLREHHTIGTQRKKYQGGVHNVEARPAQP
jgi:hypothetical protein